MGGTVSGTVDSQQGHLAQARGYIIKHRSDLQESAIDEMLRLVREALNKKSKRYGTSCSNNNNHSP